jgi:branched-chain amino acid aminotransferase
MQETEYIWMNGKFFRWQEAQVHVLTHTLHYGAGAFEGIRVYKTTQGPAVFRLEDHLKRFFYSASTVGMKIPYQLKDLVEAVHEVLRRNKLEQGYIRPLVYYGYGVMGLKPFGAPVDVAIACWPWGVYLPEKAVDLKISKFIRIHERSTVVDAKICGHYANSILSVIELQGGKYHEALFLDSRGLIAEGPGENFFIVEGDRLITPRPGTILPGLTRDTVIKLAPKLKLKVEEADITPARAFGADEAFFTGTAAEVVAIRSIDDNTIGRVSPGPVTERVLAAYQDVVYGRDAEFEGLLSRFK